MDAKPQRPLRSFKVRDENLPPDAHHGKGIHQRNKSSPALSTLAKQHGTLKTGARRTVFADLSNTAKINQNAKDDSVLANTKSALASLKETTTEQETNRPAPLLRPAQRPLSVSGIKGLLSGFGSTTSGPAKSSIDPLPGRGGHGTIWPIEKPRKATTIFKDPTATTSSEADHISRRVDRILPPAPSHAELVKQSEHEHDIQSLPLRRPATSASSQTHSYEHHLLPLPSSADYHDVRSDGIPLQSSHEVQASRPSQITQVPDQCHSTALYGFQDRAPLEPIDGKPLLNPPTVRSDDALHVLPVSGLGEYWEEEASAEKYDDDGYTTARSLRSRGDYTTGPTTIVLAPRMTAEAEQELAAAKLFVQESSTADEIEEDESWDTSMVAEYGEEIFDYMRTLEERMRPNPYYMDNQTEVQWSMRSVLMDWLIQVHHRFALLPETLFLCVNYIDRFLSCKVVSLGKLQLVGATAIFVAAKYEEINCPSVSEIQYMVDGGYTVDEILKAERFMLSMLQFELGWPGPLSFLRRISKADDYDLETRTLAKYFLEITIMDERFVGCIPSFTAAGAHCLARLMLGKGTWSQSHVYYSNYTYSQVRPLLSAMLSCCEDPEKHHAAVFDKYGDKRFKRASFFVQSEMQKGFVLPPVPTQRTGLSSRSSLDFNYLDQYEPAYDPADEKLSRHLELMEHYGMDAAEFESLSNMAR